MKIHFLGTGGAFTLKNFHTNMLLEHNGETLLIDCGSDIRFSLRDQEWGYKSIKDVYVSHLHGDHAAGLEYIGFASYFDPTMSKPRLYGSGEVLINLWDKVLSGGMGSLQMKVATLDTYFDVRSIKANESFEWCGHTCRPFATVHIMNGFVIIPSYGLEVIQPNGIKIYFTTDTQFAPHQIMDMYRDVDFIIQDTETSPYKSGVHAHFDDLCTLPAEIKAKMALVHYQDNVMGSDGLVLPSWDDKAKAAGFYGFIDRGTILNTDGMFINGELTPCQ